MSLHDPESGVPHKVGAPLDKTYEPRLLEQRI